MATNNDTTQYAGVVMRSDYDEQMARLGFHRYGEGNPGEPPTDAPGDDCPDHGPHEGDDCPNCELGSRVWLTWLKREGFVIALPNADYPYYRVRTSLEPGQSLLILPNELQVLPCQACGANAHTIQQCPAIAAMLMAPPMLFDVTAQFAYEGLLQ